MTLSELLEKLGLDAEQGEDISAFANSETAGLRRTNASLKEEKRALQSKLNALSGLDLDAVAEALGVDGDEMDLDDLPSMIVSSRQAKGEASADNDARVGELERKLNKAIQRAELAESDASDRIGRLNSKLGSRDLATIAAQEISSADGSVKGLMPHIKGRVKTVVDEDGDICHVCLAPNGEPMEDAQGNPATVKMLVDELRRDDELSGLFKAPLGGTGMKPGGNMTTSKKWAEMNLDERSELRAKNPALADRLKNQSA